MNGAKDPKIEPGSTPGISGMAPTEKEEEARRALDRKLILAALRLAVLALGFSGATALRFHQGPFTRLAKWAGAETGTHADGAVAHAMHVAVTLLVEAGEIEKETP